MIRVKIHSDLEGIPLQTCPTDARAKCQTFLKWLTKIFENRNHSRLSVKLVAPLDGKHENSHQAADGLLSPETNKQISIK